MKKKMSKNFAEPLCVWKVRTINAFETMWAEFLSNSWIILRSSGFSDQKAWNILLKALVVKNSVLHDFGFGKVSPAKQL